MIQDLRENNKIKEFTDLVAWQEAHKLVVLIYQETKKFPREEQFGLVNQMRRAAVSITSNIAEGFGRQTYKEKTQFFYLAQGSLVELKSQLFIGRDIGYIRQCDFSRIIEQINNAHKILQGLLTKTKSFLNLKS